MTLRKYMTACILWLTAFSMSAVAIATSPGEVRALIATGEYEKSRALAVQIDTAEGYFLAAESLSAQIMLGEVKKLNKQSKKARDYAKMALALDPESYDARLQYALTDGFVTRTSGDLTAWRKGLPLKTYDIIQEFRADYPDDARAMALEAAWHFGVIRKTGLKNGQKWFGASLETGHQIYQEAIARRPSDIIIKANYFMALQALNKKIDVHDPAASKVVLEEILSLQANIDLDRKVQGHLRSALTMIDDPDAVRAFAEDFLDGKLGR